MSDLITRAEQADTCRECDANLDNGFCHACDILRECCFPDCGCDGSRLCMAEAGASARALDQNVEGMWSRNGRTAHQRTKQRRAVGNLIGSIYAENKDSEK